MISYERINSGRGAALAQGSFDVFAESDVSRFGKPGKTPSSLRSPWGRSPGVGPILVVDDDPSIREIIVETLELEGYPVEQAANGAEALKKIEEQLPSLVLLDMRMPILDGWGLVSILRQRGWSLPIVVMTAAKNARTWANEIGAAAFLDKPFEDTDLLAIAERFHGKLPKQ